MTLRRSGIAAIVPTYNRAALLREALASICAQTLPPSQVIVVDDGSSDATSEVARSFDNVLYLHQENAGKAVALNLALRKVTEPLVWIFDDDDIAAPDALERLWTTLSARPDCGLAYGGYDKFRVDEGLKDPVIQSAGAPDPPEQDLLPALLERCFLFQGAMLVRRSCYETVGPFDERLIRSQDYDMLLRLVERFPAARVPHILFHQREDGGIRGTTRHNIVVEDRDRSWRAYDAMIMEKVKARLDASAYRPSSTDPEWDGFRRSGAHLHRFVVFARKAIWEDALGALRDFGEAGRSDGRRGLHAHERAALERVFDAWSYAWLEPPPLQAIRDVVATVSGARLRFQLRAGLTCSCLDRAVRLARQGDRGGSVEAVRGAYVVAGLLPFVAAAAVVCALGVVRAARSVARRARRPARRAFSSPAPVAGRSVALP